MMQTDKSFRNEQETFWEGTFGADYIGRNQSDLLLASNLSFFSKALNQAASISSVCEFGANIGMNLKALKLLIPELRCTGVEINTTASRELEKIVGTKNTHNCSITEAQLNGKFDLTMVKGVLIHINPNQLEAVYQKLVDHSNRYILISEYYNPTPVALTYRGSENKLFKRDFAGELLDKFKHLKLLDYGFSYHRDTNWPQDDINWFLLEKVS